jgi:hypothetical protein
MCFGFSLWEATGSTSKAIARGARGQTIWGLFVETQRLDSAWPPDSPLWREHGIYRLLRDAFAAKEIGALWCAVQDS